VAGTTLSPLAPPEEPSVVQSEPSPARELDRSLVRGLAWTGTMRWATQILSWASTLVVAKLLAPTDYGLVGMATVYLGLLQLVNEFGLGVAIVQRRDLTADQIARLGGLALAVGCALAGLSAALSGLVARFFGEPAVRLIVVVWSLAFVMAAAQTVPRALLRRDLDFRTLAWADGAEAFAATVTTLTLAATGFRYWALVFGTLAGRFTSTLLTCLWRPHRVAWPTRFGSIAPAVTFGWHVVVGSIAWYFYDNADFAIVGRVLGKAALGAYTLGWTIASIPVDRVTALVGSVTPPVFSAVQQDRPALQRYLRNLTEGLSLITFPAAVGIALVADEFVLLALGDRWRPAILPLQLLALAAASRSVSALLPQVIISTGHSKRSMQFTIIAAVVLPGLFYVGSHWGAAGVAAAWLVGHPVLVMPWVLLYALRLTNLSLGGYLRSLWPAAGATLAMAAAVLAVRWGTPLSWPLGGRLAAPVVVGVAVYAAAVYGAHRRRVQALWAVVRAVRE